MKIDYRYTKYNDDGTSNVKKYRTECNKDIFVECILDDVKSLLKLDWWILPAVMAISCDKIIMSFDNIEIIISTNEPNFNFEDYHNALSKMFEKIRY